MYINKLIKVDVWIYKVLHNSSSIKHFFLPSYFLFYKVYVIKLFHKV